MGLWWFRLKHDAWLHRGQIVFVLGGIAYLAMMIVVFHFIVGISEHKMYGLTGIGMVVCAAVIFWKFSWLTTIRENYDDLCPKGINYRMRSLLMKQKEYAAVLQTQPNCDEAKWFTRVLNKHRRGFALVSATIKYGDDFVYSLMVQEYKASGDLRALFYILKLNGVAPVGAGGGWVKLFDSGLFNDDPEYLYTIGEYEQAAHLGDAWAQAKHAETVGTRHERMYWLSKAHSQHSGAPMSFWDELYDVVSNKDVLSMYWIGRAYRFRSDSMWQVHSIPECVKFYYQVIERAKCAIVQWDLCAKRMYVHKDVRRVILKMLWVDREKWV